MSDVAAAARTARPESLREAREAVLDGADRGSTLLFRGGGTKLDWGQAPSSADLVVATGGLGGLLRHDPGDMTATVGAGMPLADLQEELRAAGQWLASDPADAGATVGGVVAAADYGPRRLRYGAIRDNVIGMTVVLSDGAVARSGGNVIKNVAGYDLAKLLCGSLGTLGLVAEVVVRLHPLPEATGTVRVTADDRQATALTLALMASPVEPSAIDWASGSQGEPASLWVRVEGHGPGVESQLRAVEALAGEHGLGAERLDAGLEEGAWREATDAAAGSHGETVAVTASLPDQLPTVARALQDAAEEAGVAATLRSHAALGLHHARLESGADPRAHAAAVSGWRERLRPLGATVTLRRRAPGVAAHVDAWGLAEGGRVAATVPLMRAVKLRLDPRGRCAPGRFVGGI